MLQLYRGGQFYRWRKLEDRENATDLPQDTDKHYHIILHRAQKSYYYTITTTTTPQFFRQVYTQRLDEKGSIFRTFYFQRCDAESHVSERLILIELLRKAIAPTCLYRDNCLGRSCFKECFCREN